MAARPAGLDGFVAFIRSSGIACQAPIADNVDAEAHVEPSDWDDLVATVGAAAPFDFGDYLSWCYGHQRRGPAADPPLPDRLARAVSNDQFLSFLYDPHGARGVVGNEQDAENLLQLTGDLDPASTPASAQAQIPLGRHIMWATYDPGDPSRDPAEVLTGGVPTAGADDILDRVGLPPKSEPVFVLVYRRQTTTIHVPTIADAGGHDQFRPSPPSPTGPTGPGRAVPPSGGTGVAEVVHEVVTAERLDRRLARHDP